MVDESIPTAAPPTNPDQPIASRPPGWITPIGVLATVFASLGLVFTALAVVVQHVMPGLFDPLSAVRGASDDPGIVAAFDRLSVANTVAYAIGLPLAVLHLVAGVGILRRRIWGVSMARLWSWTNIAFVALTTPVLAVSSTDAQMTLNAFMACASGGAPLHSGSFVIGWAIVFGILGVAIASAWPGFLLIWLGRKTIKRDVARHFEPRGEALPD